MSTNFEERFLRIFGLCGHIACLNIWPVACIIPKIDVGFVLIAASFLSSIVCNTYTFILNTNNRNEITNQYLFF